MTITALELGADARRQLNRLASFAIQPENFYRPGPDAAPPGDDDRFVVTSGTHRIVFSVTVMNEKSYRHLSVSIFPGDMPNPASVFTIAHLLGFQGIAMHADCEVATGAIPESVHIGTSERPPSVIVAQEL